MRNIRISLIASLAALPLLASALAGCHHKAQPPAPAALAQAGVLLSGGRLVLPAVPGHPGAAYFTLVNQGHTETVLNTVTIAGVGQAEMHESMGNTMQSLPTVSIRAGGSEIFAPGGKHVMAFTLAPGLVPGTKTLITLGFSDGSKITAPLSIEAAGGMAPGGMGDMSGMKM